MSWQVLKVAFKTVVDNTDDVKSKSSLKFNESNAEVGGHQFTSFTDLKCVQTQCKTDDMCSNNPCLNGGECKKRAMSIHVSARLGSQVKTAGANIGVIQGQTHVMTWRLAQTSQNNTSAMMS